VLAQTMSADRSTGSGAFQFRMTGGITRIGRLMISWCAHHRYLCAGPSGR
jgi:hypothetical protein